MIFGYLKAVQEYCEVQALHRFKFSTLAFQRMRSSLSNYYKCLSRPKRNAPVVSFSELIGDEGGLYWEEVISRQDELFQRLEAEMCLHALTARLPRREMRIIRMKVRGDRMHDIAKRERMTFRQINQALERCYSDGHQRIMGVILMACKNDFERYLECKGDEIDNAAYALAVALLRTHPDQTDEEVLPLGIWQSLRRLLSRHKKNWSAAGKQNLLALFIMRKRLSATAQEAVKNKRCYFSEDKGGSDTV